MMMGWRICGDEVGMVETELWESLSAGVGW